MKVDKNMEIEETLNVKIKNIEVDQWYFSFDWIIIRGDKVSQGTYDSDHSWQNDIKNFRKMLINGHAVNLALESSLVLK